jgi:hypothetical protein
MEGSRQAIENLDEKGELNETDYKIIVVKKL